MRCPVRKDHVTLSGASLAVGVVAVILDENPGVGLRKPLGCSPASEPLKHAEIMRMAQATFQGARDEVSHVGVSSSGEAVMVRQIVIELETPGDSRTMFRLRINGSLIADNLTAAQAHLLVGEVFERITLPKSTEEASSITESDTDMRAPAPSMGQSRSRLRVLVDMLLGREDAAA